MNPDIWNSLRHGGNLLSPEVFGKLPEPAPVPFGLADRLRTAFSPFGGDVANTQALSTLLDVVLQDACGFRDGWTKGSALGASEAEKLLDGTVFKPRRRWTGPENEGFVVFTTQVSRLGIGKGRRIVAYAVEYLRRRKQPLGLVTNGNQWRLIWADTDSLAWVEWEADRWLSGDRLGEELAVLRWVLSPKTLCRGSQQAGPLLSAIVSSRRGQAKLSKELGERVRQAVETLLKSRQAVLNNDWEQHKNKDIYDAACHFVMRLVVILFAEARELLPIDNPVYYQAYGLRGLLDQLNRLKDERRRSRQGAWPRLLALFRLVYEGSPHPALILPAYGGDLFRPGDPDGDGVQRALVLLEESTESPDDDAIFRMLVLLTRTTQKVREGSAWKTVAAPVDFTELSSEYIGILYEGLLDYELHRADKQPIVFLNLGDEPALPLDRLEGMDDKQVAALVEKARIKKEVADSDDGDGDADEADDEVNDEERVDPDDEPTMPGVDDAAQVAEGLAPYGVDGLTQAWTRAVSWANRAVVAARLVTKPKQKGGLAAIRYDQEVSRCAKTLISAVKTPGELYLVRWGGTRKGAGTFYTPPKLTRPTVRRTMAPLIWDEHGGIRPPEGLLALKVCDPAMGSGSFLVAALHVLTQAVIESLFTFDRVHPDNGRTRIDCAALPESDRVLPTEGFAERLEAVVRRAVVEQCLYGVDIDPLAVELGRVALWVETLDKKLPLTFLDHKLRCGNALLGTWLDRFRDYPLLALDRQSPDWKTKGVFHSADVWHNALKNKKAAAISEQVALLGAQRDFLRATTDDEALKTAIERVRRLYGELRKVPSGRPDERARIWRERILPDDALSRVREAFDTWCAVWFWPLDQLDVLPLPLAFSQPGEVVRAVVRNLRHSKRFFHWELEFPDVFTQEGAGFDAVVGNPPWEIQKPNSREFFSNHDPLYRAYGKQEALRIQQALFEEDPNLERLWLVYNGEFKDRGNFVKHTAEPFGDGKVAGHGGGDTNLGRGGGSADIHKKWRSQRGRYKGLSDPAHPFRHQGSADLNTYKMFVEQSHALLRAGGQLGLVVPSGIYTDKGTGELREWLLHHCEWRWLYGFENRNKLFDIHRSFKFCVLIAQKEGRTQGISAAFMRHDLEDWGLAKEALVYPAERVTAFSPTSLSILEIRSEQDLQVLTKMYQNSVLLGDKSPDGWGITYAREFDMTNDSKLFVARDKAEAQGYQPDVYGRWVNAEGEVLLPLYEGRMIGQFDFSQKGWVSGKGRTAVWREIPWEDKRIEPQFLTDTAAYRESRSNGPNQSKVVFIDVTASTNQRTMVAAALHGFPCGNTAPILLSRDAIGLMSVLNSFSFDCVTRQRCGGLHLNYFVIEETPLVKPTKAASLLSHVGLLLAWGGAIAQTWALSNAKSTVRRRSAVTPHERLRLRCQLDAIVAVLYGLDRDDFAWILKDCDHPTAHLSEKAFCRMLDPKGFWRVDKHQDPELRHTVLSLAAFDDLQAAITQADGDRDRGIQAFCDQHDGDGWMLPETLCLAELNLTRTVQVGDYDHRAQEPQPVRSRMGDRFLDWQLKQTPEESWAECERHAKILAENQAAAPTPKQPEPIPEPQKPTQLKLL